jgi:hypothetical protein
VAAAEGASKSTRTDILSRLAAADRYTVFDRGGRRIGTFIELVGASGARIAVRHDALLLWHRRVLPVTTVASVFPEHHAIVLNVDRRALKSIAADAVSTPVGVKPVADTPPADEAGGVDEDWQTRIARFIGTDESDTDAATVGAEDEPTGANEDVGRKSAALQASAESSEGAENPTGRCLLFVPTKHGYQLVEQQGPAPAAFDYVELSEPVGVFRVAKLAISPLPNDRRVCAYLDWIE